VFLEDVSPQIEPEYFVKLFCSQGLLSAFVTALPKIFCIFLFDLSWVMRDHLARFVSLLKKGTI